MSTERLNEGMYNKLAISQLEQDRIDGVEDEEVKEEKK